MTSINIDQHVTDLYERGYTALPGFFSPDECQQMRDIMDDYWHSQGSPSLSENAFGFTIHPMMGRVPEMAPFLDRPEPVEILRQALRDEVRLVHLGARVSGPQSFPRLPWHNHYASPVPGINEESGWNAEDLPRRDRLERILAGVYVDGTLPEYGALIASPRRYNDPLGEPLGELTDAWPGEVKVELPPGSFSIFDTALWHSAVRGTGANKRRLWGGHYQGWSETRAHIEDNDVDAAQIASYKESHPHLRSLLERGPALVR